AVLSGAAIVHSLVSSAADAAISPPLVTSTTHASIQFATTNSIAGAASVRALELAQGALKAMIPVKTKILSIAALGLTILALSAAMMPSFAYSDPHGPAAIALADEPNAVAQKQPAKEGDKKPKHCVIFWMSGGPSQVDTFDPKDGAIALFKAIDTNVK